MKIWTNKQRKFSFIPFLFKDENKLFWKYLYNHAESNIMFDNKYLEHIFGHTNFERTCTTVNIIINLHSKPRIKLRNYAYLVMTYQYNWKNYVILNKT